MFGRFVFLGKEMLFCAPFSSSSHGVSGGSDEEVPAWTPSSSAS